MKIGIDISQTAYGGTGVANYLTKLVENLLEVDKHNDYVLFYSSLRRDVQHSKLYALKNNPQVRLVTKKLPPSVLELLWNKLHIYPIERVLGDIDIFITSDWTEPPVLRAKKITILYDLIVYKYPEESHDQTNFSLKNARLTANIVTAQKRRLKWVQKECEKILCISNATKKDAKEILGIPEEKLAVIYPGFSL